jgi:DNA repair protein RecO (recombination protein O)
MLHKTRGIVLKATDYGESSVIVQLFTEKFGLQSYIINGAKKPKAKIGRNMLQPLHLLDLVVYHKNTGSVQRISELKNSPALQTIPYDVIKSCIAIFLNDVLYKAIKQQSAEGSLFDFVFSAIEWRGYEAGYVYKIPHRFKGPRNRARGVLTDRYLASNADYFDMKNGTFSKYRPDSLLYLSPPHTQNFGLLLQCSFENMHQLKFSNDERRYLIQKILEYYALHIEGFGNIRSADVLEEVLS